MLPLPNYRRQFSVYGLVRLSASQDALTFPEEEAKHSGPVAPVDHVDPDGEDLAVHRRADLRRTLGLLGKALELAPHLGHGLLSVAQGDLLADDGCGHGDAGEGADIGVSMSGQVAPRIAKAARPQTPSPRPLRATLGARYTPATQKAAPGAVGARGCRAVVRKRASHVWWPAYRAGVSIDAGPAFCVPGVVEPRWEAP